MGQIRCRAADDVLDRFQHISAYFGFSGVPAKQ